MPFSFRVKHGNKTWVNGGKLATTVQQINFAHEPVNRFSKRSIIAKTTNSGRSLQENQLESLVMTSATSTSCGCVDSPPEWDIGTHCGCPIPVIQTYSAAVNSYQINFDSNNDYYTITVNYTRCSGNQTGGYPASATSHNYPNKNNTDKNQYALQSNCIINQQISCNCGQGVYSCPAGAQSGSCINIT